MNKEWKERLDKAIEKSFAKLNNMTKEELSVEISKWTDNPETLALMCAWDYSPKVNTPESESDD